MAPDGSHWTVRRIGAPWHLRHRVRFELDILGVLLWLVAWVALLAEAVVWVGGWAILRLRRSLGVPWVIEARTAGSPDRLLRWRVVGSAASAAKVAEIAAGIAQGRDVASTAADRVIGGSTLRG